MARQIRGGSDAAHTMRLAKILALCLAAARTAAAAEGNGDGVVVRVWQSQDGLPSNVVRSVVQSADGYLWLATAEGVARFDGSDFETVRADRDLRRDRLAFFRLFATANGSVWAATFQGGLFRVTIAGFDQVLEDSKRPNPPLVSQVVQAPDGLVWLRRGDEILRLAGGRPIAEDPPAEAVARMMEADLKEQEAHGRRMGRDRAPQLADGSGWRWLAGEGGGLAALAGTERITVSLPQRGPVFNVNELMLDREGNVWVATQVNGLARIHRARVNTVPVAPGAGDQAFSCLLQERSGAWWIADLHSGLYRWTPEEARHFNIRSRNNRPASALFEDRDGRLWLASRDGSVFLRENGTFQPQFARTQTPSKVRAISQDASGTLWFGSVRGLASFDGREVRDFGKAGGLGDADITVLCPFPGGGMIAGTADGAVLLENGGKFTILATAEVFGYPWISGILPLSPDEIWVSTRGAGLWLWDGREWHGFGTADGLPDLRLTCVIRDDREYLWLGSLGGIIRASRQEMRNHAAGSGQPIHWLVLDHSDGMPSRECLGGFQPSAWRARDGQLWFPTGGGVVRVRPDQIEPNTVPPPAVIRAVRVNGVARDTGGPVTTDPGRARLEFRFVGLSFTAPEKTTYRARLLGIDDGWNELGNRSVAAYEAVPPGRYTFQVVAVNGDGVASASPAGITVFVPPRWWQSAAFYFTAGGLALIAATGFGWFTARLRLKRRIQALKIRHARETERARIARDLHDDLGADLTEISILAALAAEDGDTSSMRGSLDQLSHKAKHAVTSLDEIVWAVNPREDTLRSLVEYLAAFAREFLDLAGISLRTDIATDIPDLPLPSTVRHAIFLASREALNNLVKHARATEAHLAIAISGTGLEIRVADNGRGFSGASSGDGIGNLATRMADAGGTCVIESAPGSGTTVFLNLPLPGPGAAH